MKKSSTPHLDRHIIFKPDPEVSDFGAWTQSPKGRRVIAERHRRIRNAHGGTLPKKFRRAA